MDTVPLIQTESSTDHSKKRTEEILDNSSVQEVVADELRTTNANSNGSFTVQEISHMLVCTVVASAEKPAKVQRTAGIFGECLLHLCKAKSFLYCGRGCLQMSSSSLPPSY